MRDTAFIEGVDAHEKALLFYDTADPFPVKVIPHHEIVVVEFVRPMSPKDVESERVGVIFCRNDKI